MPAANPLIGAGAPVASVAAAAPTPDSSGDTFTPDLSGSVGAGGYGVALGADFSHPDNNNVHVAILVAVSLGVIIFLHASGFRFAVDAGVTRR